MTNEAKRPEFRGQVFLIQRSWKSVHSGFFFETDFSRGFLTKELAEKQCDLMSETYPESGEYTVQTVNVW